VEKHFKLLIGIMALVISVILYFFDFLITGDSNHMFFQILDNLSFIPLNVFVTVVILERLIVRQEKQGMLKKMNMVVGAFFSEVGNKLLHAIISYVESNAGDSQQLAVNPGWKRADYKSAIAFAASMGQKSNWSAANLEELKALLVAKRPFLLGLLENPNLLEHEQFTDLLWAIFHLDEELEARQSLKDLTPADRKHIEWDISRVYGNLASQWLLYAEHLQKSYPYLFSLAVRMNPFLEQPSPVVS
jgi:hypothetical protein